MQRGVVISDVLRAQLRARGWTQKELAERSDITREDINGFCNGKRVGEERLKRLADALGMQVADLRAAAQDGRDASEPPDLDGLLVSLEAHTDEPLSMVAVVLRLLARRLELVERQVALRDQRARA